MYQGGTPDMHKNYNDGQDSKGTDGKDQRYGNYENTLEKYGIHKKLSSPPRKLIVRDPKSAFKFDCFESLNRGRVDEKVDHCRIFLAQNTFEIRSKEACQVEIPLHHSRVISNSQMKIKNHY